MGQSLSHTQHQKSKFFEKLPAIFCETSNLDVDLNWSIHVVSR